MDKTTCILPSFHCQGTKKGLERKAWREFIAWLFHSTLDGAAHDIPTTRFYDHLIVW